MLHRLRHSILTVICAAAVGIAVTTVVWRNEAQRLQAYYDRSLTEVGARISDQITRDIAFLAATRAWLEVEFESGLEAGIRHLGREDFANYVQKLGLRAPDGGLQGLGFVPIIAPGAEGDVGARLASDYGLEVGVWPQSNAPLRTAISLLEPTDPRNRAALGYDMYTEPTRRAAMDRALQTGEATATSPVTLVQEIVGERQAGLLIFLPVFEQGETGRQAEGFVYSPIRAGELFQEALKNLVMPLDLIAVDQDAPEVPLYRSKGYSEEARGARSRLTLTVADRIWKLEAQHLETAGLLATWPFTFLTGTIMALLSVLAGVAVHGMNAAIRKARALNRVQESLLREKDLHLREMSHRMKNSLTRVAAMARQAARGADSKEIYVTSMTKRLQAMASAQDMLTRSENGRASLRSLIEAELAQIDSSEDAARSSAPVIEGPATWLDPRDTQALGLSFHELATNALKYGAGSVEGGKITITWKVTGTRDRRELHLLWLEESPVPRAERDGQGQQTQQNGFGSQLLETCIRIELGGAIWRSFTETGMRVEIFVPLGEG